MYTDTRMPPPASGLSIFSVSFLMMLAICVIGVLIWPSETGVIISACTAILIALLAILKGQNDIHISFNSRMDQFLEEVKEGGEARGNLAGRAEQKAESAAHQEGRDSIESKEPKVIVVEEIKAEVIQTESLEHKKVPKAK